MALRALIEDCVANHSGCTLGELSLLPSMLLQISETVANPSVRLVKSSDIAERLVRYVFLSYCWGGEQPGKTMLSRLSSYLAGIDTALISIRSSTLRVSVGGCVFHCVGFWARQGR